MSQQKGFIKVGLLFAGDFERVPLTNTRAMMDYIRENFADIVGSMEFIGIGIDDANSIRESHYEQLVESSKKSGWLGVTVHFCRPDEDADEEAVCHADKDGDCSWEGCPQLQDNEPATTGRHCPLDTESDEAL